MNQKLVVLFLLLFSICQAQEDFKNGYIITNSGDRQEVLIYDYNWKSNPSSITYKKSENGEKLSGTLQNISEFGILKEARYKRAEVDIEHSSDITNNLSRTGEPRLKTKTVFLKMLVDGSADLFVYTEGSKKNFFIQKNDDSAILPLIYKKYRDETNTIKVNEQYRQQLFNTLNCDDARSEKLRNTEYKQKDLINFVSGYNECENSEGIVYKGNTRKTEFHVAIRPGLNFTNLDFDFVGEEQENPTFDAQTSIRIGLEFELLLPFNDQRWALTLDPAYRTFKVSDSVTRVYNIANQQRVNVTFEHTSIEFPVGIKHYVNLSDRSRIFLGAQVIPELILTGELDSGITDNRYEDYSAGTSLGFSFGYSWNRKISINARFDTPRNLSEDFSNSKMTNFAVILGYTIF